jgi:hypothetical protein
MYVSSMEPSHWPAHDTARFDSVGIAHSAAGEVKAGLSSSRPVRVLITINYTLLAAAAAAVDTK